MEEKEKKPTEVVYRCSEGGQAEGCVAEDEDVASSNGSGQKKKKK